MERNSSHCQADDLGDVFKIAKGVRFDHCRALDDRQANLRKILLTTPRKLKTSEQTTSLATPKTNRIINHANKPDAEPAASVRLIMNWTWAPFLKLKVLAIIHISVADNTDRISISNFVSQTDSLWRVRCRYSPKIIGLYVYYQLVRKHMWRRDRDSNCWAANPADTFKSAASVGISTCRENTNLMLNIAGCYPESELNSGNNI